MLTPVVCFTCGLSLGDLAAIYNRIRAKRMAARYGAGEVAPTQASLDPSTTTESVMGDVLDALRLTKCCRTRMVTAMQFSEHY